MTDQPNSKPHSGTSNSNRPQWQFSGRRNTPQVGSPIERPLRTVERQSQVAGEIPLPGEFQAVPQEAAVPQPTPASPSVPVAAAPQPVERRSAPRTAPPHVEPTILGVTETSVRVAVGEAETSAREAVGITPELATNSSPEPISVTRPEPATPISTPKSAHPQSATEDPMQQPSTDQEQLPAQPLTMAERKRRAKLMAKQEREKAKQQKKAQRAESDSPTGGAKLKRLLFGGRKEEQETENSLAMNLTSRSEDPQAQEVEFVSHGGINLIDEPIVGNKLTDEPIGSEPALAEPIVAEPNAAEPEIDMPDDFEPPVTPELLAPEPVVMTDLMLEPEPTAPAKPEPINDSAVESSDAADMLWLPENAEERPVNAEPEPITVASVASWGMSQPGTPATAEPTAVTSPPPTEPEPTLDAITERAPTLQNLIDSLDVATTVDADPIESALGEIEPLAEHQPIAEPEPAEPAVFASEAALTPTPEPGVIASTVQATPFPVDARSEKEREVRERIAKKQQDLQKLFQGMNPQ